MRPASQRFFIHSCIYLRILIISYLAMFVGTNSHSVLICRKAVSQSILSFSALDFSHNITHLENTITNASKRMSSNFLSLNPSKTAFLIFCLPQQLSKLNNPTIHLPNNVILLPVDYARNLGVIFDKNLSFVQHISFISKSCFHNIRDLRHIRNTIDQTTADTIATTLIRSKIDYCNSLLLNLPATNESSSTCP